MYTLRNFQCKYINYLLESSVNNVNLNNMVALKVNYSNINKHALAVLIIFSR